MMLDSNYMKVTIYCLLLVSLVYSVSQKIPLTVF